MNIKVRIVKNKRVIETLEFEVPDTLSIYDEYVDIWTRLAALAKAQETRWRADRKNETAASKKKHERMAKIREAMQPILGPLALDKLMKRLERYNYTHAVWAPFTTEKERIDDGSVRTPQRRSEQEHTP